MSEWDDFQGWKQYAHNLLGHDFFSDFQGLLKDKDKGPQVNICESENELFCLVAVPGLQNIKDIDVYVNYKTLKIQGKIAYKFKGFRLTHEELYEGSFNREIDLPFPVRDHPIDATYEKGLLLVHLHRLIEKNEQKSKVRIKELDD